MESTLERRASLEENPLGGPDLRVDSRGRVRFHHRADDRTYRVDVSRTGGVTITRRSNVSEHTPYPGAVLHFLSDPRFVATLHRAQQLAMGYMA